MSSKHMGHEKPKDQAPGPSPGTAAAEDRKQEPAESPPKSRLVDITARVLGRAIVITVGASPKKR